MNRNIPIFAIITTLIVREFTFEQVAKGKIRDFLIHFNLRSYSFQGALSVFIVFFVIILFSYLPDKKPYLKYNIDFTNYPTEAVALIKKINPNGNIFSWEGWSGYLLWELFPTYRVFFDAKGGFGKKQINDYYEIMKPQSKWDSTLTYYNITTILLPKGKPLALLLKESREWYLAYSDSLVDLFMKKQHRYKK